MYSTHEPTKEHIARLLSKSPDLKISVAHTEQQALQEAPTAEILWGHRFLRQVLPFADNLRWIQSSSLGIDRLLSVELLNRPILLTRSTVLAPLVARHAYVLAWALIRKLPEFFERQSRGIWDPSVEMPSIPRTALILGFGLIGKELGKLLRRDGIQIWGVKREIDLESKEYCDKLILGESWRDLLPDVDLCFLTLPLTRQTLKIFDERALRKLPPHAILINVGRGALIDTDALIRVLKEGHLGGVGLDVVPREPLAREDPFWKIPRCLITPHVAAHFYERRQLLEDFFEKQLDRFLKGEPLEGVVNLREYSPM